jgi:hypothetical protein
MVITVLRYTQGLGKCIFDWCKSNKYKVKGFGSENGFNFAKDYNLRSIAKLSLGSNIFFNYGHIDKLQQVKMLTFWHDLNYNYNHYIVNFFNREQANFESLITRSNELNSGSSKCKCILIETGIDPYDMLDQENPEDTYAFDILMNTRIDELIDHETVMKNVVEIVKNYETDN